MKKTGTMKASSQYRIGDSVIVKPDVHDPDLGVAIGGWQGTISDISDEYNTVCIDWDSQTLQTMPSSVIDSCEEKGLAWNQMYLEVTETDIDDLYGVLVRVKRQRQTYHFPLCDLKAIDRRSPNYNPVQAYAVWFANR